MKISLFGSCRICGLKDTLVNLFNNNNIYANYFCYLYGIEHIIQTINYIIVSPV